MTHRVLRAASITIQEFLQQALTLRGYDGANSVDLRTPAEFGSHGVSLWLYSVVRDEHRLNDPDTALTSTRHRRAALPLRAHYLVTPLADEPSSEQGLLGAALAAFHDTPTLRGSVLKAELAGSEATITMRLEQLPIAEMSLIWDALQRPYQLSISYEAAILYVESEVDTKVAPVIELITETGGLVSPVSSP